MSKKRTEKARRAYLFLCEAEREDRPFTFQELAEETGWELVTVRTYRSKKWSNFIFDTKKGLCCRGILELSEEAFLRLHSQSSRNFESILRPTFSEKTDSLIDKSREAALLAVQTYNNPLVSFRAYGYIVQMIIAYTALFHAVFERDKIEYWYTGADGVPDMQNGERRYWDLTECLRKYFHGTSEPIVANIKLFVGLRNKIEHRPVPTLDADISGFCQALLTNYEGLLVDEFGEYFAIATNLSLALQLSKFSPQLSHTLRGIHAENYEIVREYINRYQKDLAVEVLQSPRYCFRAFVIPKLGNHATSSDIALEFVKYDPENPRQMELYEKQVALIRERKVQVANEGYMLPSEVVRKVQEKSGILGFNVSMHTKAWKLYKVRQSPPTPDTCDTRFCQFSEPFQQVIYTDEWVEFLCKRVTDAEEFERIRRFRA